MSSHDSSLEEIKDRVDIVDLISEYVTLKKTGQNWKGLCPFHTEKTPSFTVSPAKQIYHCFGCGTGGDIFTFLVKYENLTFPEALRMLAKKAGVTLKASRTSPLQSGEKETLIDMHKAASHFFQQHLSKSPKALEYLRIRGINEEYQKIFSVGYAPKSWNALLSYLTRKGYKPDRIKKAGLAAQGAKGFYDSFRDRVMFPIYDFRGEVVAFGGRAIDGSEPKYLNSPETLIFNKRKVLYGLNFAKDSIKDAGYVMFMEGYLDVIMSCIHGFSNAVAPLGTALTQEHGKLIRRFTEDVILVFDSDAAGVKAARTAAGTLMESGLNVKILSIPGNEDPDSFLRKKGKEAFERLLKSPLSVVEFIVRQGGEKHLIADDVFGIVSKVPNEILQDEYITELSEKLNVNEERVRERFRKIRKQLKAGYRRQAPEVKHATRPKPVNEEVFIIKLLLQLPEKIETLSGQLSTEDFKDEILRGIFQKIQERPSGVDDIVAECEGEEKDLLTRISLEDDFEDPEKVLVDCIQRLKDNKRKILLRDLQGRIKEAERSRDFDLLKQLQSEQQKLFMSGKKK